MSQTEDAVTAERSPHLATSEVLLQRILVAVDFSQHSTQAVEQAIAVARCFGAEILLVYAAAPRVYETGIEPLPFEPFGNEIAMAEAKMAELLRKHPALQELRHREIIASGYPVELVRQLVEENKVDLVVTGSRGAGGLDLLALGSVAESILGVVSCPVLIVGPQCQSQENPFLSILFATDLGIHGLRDAQFASSFAERFHAQLTLLHVVDEKFHHGPDSVLEEKELRDELACLLPPDINTYTSAEIRIEHGKPGTLIPQTAQALRASLIVMGFDGPTTLGDHLPWTTLSQVVREAPCPVLSVRRHLV